MAIVHSLVEGITLGAAGVLGLLAVYYVVTLLRLVASGVSLETAIPRTAGRVYGYILGAVALVGIVLTHGIQFVDLVTNGIATMPLFATNAMTALLALLGIRGTIDTVTMLVAAAAFVGFAVILREANARGA